MHSTDQELTLLSTDVQTHPEPQALIDLNHKFVSIFQEPHSLPPYRGICDHRIPLQPNSKPLNIRPNRYPETIVLLGDFISRF